MNVMESIFNESNRTSYDYDYYLRNTQSNNAF